VQELYEFDAHEADIGDRVGAALTKVLEKF